MKTLKEKLSLVYKAKDCTDLRDVDTAIVGVYRLVIIYGWTPALRRRMASLTKKKRKLRIIKKSKR
jgi:hypothetical protein